MRVAQHCKIHLEAIGHEVELIDPLSIELPASFKPHFAYARSAAPEALDVLAAKIEAADGYVMVSPEYNHSMSPALANLLNHFGSSLFSYKPSAIVTYSAGQWGGARAAAKRAVRGREAPYNSMRMEITIDGPLAAQLFEEAGRIESKCPK